MSAPLWTSEAAARATGGRSSAPWAATGVSIDSRTLEPGDLFVALKGPNQDGHRYLAQAFARGAAAAMVSEDVQADGPLLRVADTQAALEALGRARRAESRARIAAVTGSVGKTGTKEALRHALGRQAKTHASVASYNNQWGVPLTLARMPADAAYGVFEIGMNHAGEIAALAPQVRPHVAIVTSIEPVHLEFFAGLEAIADAKAEIFLGLEPGGVAVVNRDTPHFGRLKRAALAAGAARVLGFGAHGEAEARLIKLAAHPTCSCVSAEIDGQAATYKVGAPGRHWALNSLAVLAAVKALGADLGLAALSLAEISAPKGRGERHAVELRGGSFELIDESYNANPASMRAALELLAAAPVGPRGRRIAALGDMRELGPTAPQLHAELAETIAERAIDLVFACGPHMARLYEALPQDRRGAYAEDSEALRPKLLGAVRPGDVVMVKGSLGSRMGPLVEALLQLGRAAAPRAANGGG